MCNCTKSSDPVCLSTPTHRLVFKDEEILTVQIYKNFYFLLKGESFSVTSTITADAKSALPWQRVLKWGMQ